MVAWLLGCLVAWLVGWLVACLGNCLTGGWLEALDLSPGSLLLELLLCVGYCSVTKVAANLQDVTRVAQTGQQIVPAAEEHLQGMVFWRPFPRAEMVSQCLGSTQLRYRATHASLEHVLGSPRFEWLAFSGPGYHGVVAQ